MEYGTLEHLAHEAFIRRAAKLAMLFMLKGSYVSRQYFPERVPRYPADLDWVYLDYMEDPVHASARFDAWMIAVTELDVDDGIKFRSFSENRFWRMMDYAMADDFPTVNTDIVCWIAGEELEFAIDISFNLDVEQPPVPLLYKPYQGNSFEIPFTVPLSLQVSWKIHQTLVRPRFKDLFDLCYLVRHPAFNEAILEHTLQALVNECVVDNVNTERLRYFLNYDFEKLFPPDSIEGNWSKWRYGINAYGYIPSSIWESQASEITDVSILPETFNDFQAWVASSLGDAGIDASLINRLPDVSHPISTGYRDLPNSYLRSNSDLKPYGTEHQPLKNPFTYSISFGELQELRDAVEILESPMKRGFFATIKNWFRRR